MRKLLSVLVIAAACALPTVAMAGGGCGSNNVNGAGFQCTNQCPLAQKANTCRATGTEASKTSILVRTEKAKKVAGNLDRI